MKKALIIELGSGHSELLYSHVKLLGGLSYKLYFLGLSDNERMQNEHYPEFEEVLIFGKQQTKSFRFFMDIRKWVREKNIELIVLNTARGSTLLKLIYFIPRQITVVGVVHSVERFIKSTSQRILRNRVKKFLFLSKTLCESAPEYDGIKKSYIYPIYFNFSKIDRVMMDERLHVAIPGNIEKIRRDYGSLIEFVFNNKDILTEKCVFHILGNASIGDGDWFRMMVNDRKINDFFRIYNDFIPISSYYRAMQECHCVMPLISKYTADHEKYLNYKISGSFNLAYGFNKPLIMDGIFSNSSEFRELGLFYKNESELLSLLIGEKIRMFDFPKTKFLLEKQQSRLKRLINE